MLAATLWYSSPGYSFSLAGDPPCPDFLTTRCIEAIRGRIDAVDYDGARDLAEAQCEAQPAVETGERLTETVLSTQAAGCYHLFVLERFLGRTIEAVTARDRARRMAIYGCDHGFAELCRVLLGFVDRQLDDLLGEVRVTLREPGAAELRAASLRDFTGSREMPVAFLEAARHRLAESWRMEGLELRQCPACRPPAAGQTVLSGSLPARILDADLVLEGGSLSLRLTVRDTASQRIVFERHWQTRDLEERQRLFGFDAEVPKSVAEVRRINEWTPDYAVLAGMGVANIPNTSGDRYDARRLVVEIRAAERFHGRRTEFGMMLALQITQRLYQARFGRKEDVPSAPGASDGEDPEAAQEPDTPETPQEEYERKVAEAREKAIRPYQAAYAVYGYVGRIVAGDTAGWTGMRLGLTFGAGVFVAPNVAAPSLRSSLDFYVGRRFVLSPIYTWVGKSSIPLAKGVEVTTKPVQGPGIVFSWNF